MHAACCIILFILKSQWVLDFSIVLCFGRWTSRLLKQVVLTVSFLPSQIRQQQNQQIRYNTLPSVTARTTDTNKQLCYWLSYRVNATDNCSYLAIVNAIIELHQPFRRLYQLCRCVATTWHNLFLHKHVTALQLWYDSDTESLLFLINSDTE